MIDTETNRLLWRDTSTRRRQRPDRSARADLAAASGRVSSLSWAALRRAQTPQRARRSAEAYDLYLRSKPLTSDTEPNLQAIAMLERSVRLDPDYAPAWAELGSATTTSAAPAAARPTPNPCASSERALSLDPNLSDARQNLIVLEVEGGKLREAYRRHERALAAEADRRAGRISRVPTSCAMPACSKSPRGNATRQRRPDRGNREFRSCGTASADLGDYAAAREFYRVDAGSGWSKAREANLLLREGKREAAAAQLASIRGAIWASLVLRTGDPTDRDRAAADLEAGAMSDRDPENRYGTAAWLAAFGYRDAALRLLRKAVEGNYLAPATDKNALFDSIRQDPEFAAIRAEAIRRQKEFLANRAAEPSS